jgi:hypothetical protein
LLAEMTDGAIVDIDRALHHERFTGIDARDELVVTGKSVFDIADLADTL